jgi:hypothetical protein
MTRQRPPYLQLVAADGKDIANTSHHVARQHKPLDILMPAPIEGLALAVLRHLCACFGSRTTLGWERAHDLAEAALGLSDGPALVAHLTALLRAVRSERAQCFSYMATDCPTCGQRITDDELLIVLLLRAAQGGRRKRIAQLAASLAQRPEAPRTDAAATALGGALAAYALSIELRLPGREPPEGAAEIAGDGHGVVSFQQRPNESGHAT